ncbi:hypothetical protein MCOR30_003843 [Pyricularia oryzae]|nr:hypothetical protein MCOR30_003843 [Pyricularia oryzae]
MNSADEGYSEAPLNTLVSTSFYKSHSSNRSPVSDLLLQHMSDLSIANKTELTLALLDELPTSVVAEIIQRLNPRLYIDFIMYLPAEICLKILGYLDPLSLINLAKACRAWHNLASDGKLWERIYYREGWKTIKSEIDLWEDKVNAAALSGSSLNGPLHRLRSSEDGHTHKKRAITSPTRSTPDDNRDADFPMLDDVAMGGSSIFGSGSGSSDTRTCVTPGISSLNVNGLSGDSKGKGKEPAHTPRTTLSRETSDIKPESLPEIIPAETNLPKTTLWNWHTNSNRYRLNWKYMYATRHRLEQNWESGKFVNFQFPHPNHPEEGHKECIYSLQFNSEYLVSGSRDKTVRIWDMYTRRLVRSPLVGHKGSVLCLQFDSDPDEDIIVTGSSDSDVIIWKFSTGEMIQRLKGAHHESVLNVKFDKRILVTCSKDKTIKVFNRRPIGPGEAGYGETDAVYGVGQVIQSQYAQYDGIDNLAIKPPYTMIGALKGHGAAVNAVQIFGNEVVSASGDRNLKIWDWPTQHCRCTYIGHAKGIACVQYDGKRIVSGSNDNAIKVFDSRTGLEVASLRGHTDLVRTVQAGFADLPYSDYEDAEEARRLDKKFSAAVRAGTLLTQTRGRPRNAGSSRPEELTAYGAKLPPGGGGGKYARIVSGSYDESIIVWRRNREGKWYKQHHLRQEEAALAAASRPTDDPANHPGRGLGGHGRPVDVAGLTGAELELHRLRAQRQPESADAAAAGPPSSGSGIAGHSHRRPARPRAQDGAAPTRSQPTSERDDPTRSMPESHRGSSAGVTANGAAEVVNGQEVAGGPQYLAPGHTPSIHATSLSSSSARSLAHMIDVTVPQGVYALQQALSNFPAMVALQPQLQAAIDREPNPMVRSQMRQAVSTAVVRAQLAQARAQRENMHSLRVVSNAARAADASGGSAGPSAASSRPQAASSNSAPTVLPSGRPAMPADDTGLPPMDLPAVTASSSSTGSPAETAAAAVTSTTNGAPPPGPPPAPSMGPAHPVLPVAVGARQNQAVADERTPVRIFKLQFDVRRIICCSQTSVIVGWDFCNGDQELEEASRFWATVE